MAVLNSSTLRTRGPRRILILRPGALGDIARTLPALRALKHLFPQSRLEWVVYDPWKDLLLGHPDLGEVIVVRRGRRGSPRRNDPFPPPPSFPELVRELRGRRYELSLDFQGTFRSGLLAFLSGCPHRIGFSRPFCREGNFLLNNHHVSLPTPHFHRVEKNLELVRALGSFPEPLRVPLSLPVREKATGRKWISRFNPAGKPVILLFPGSSSRQAYKRWPPPYFARLAFLLHRAGGCPLIGWGPGERDLALWIQKESGGTARMLPPNRLLEMAAVMLLSSCVVAGDTGPMHLASLLRAPVVALFGGTDPRLNAPWGPRFRILDGSPRPAGRRHRQRFAPRFLASLLPERVAEAALDLLSERGVDGGAISTEH